MPASKFTVPWVKGLQPPTDKDREKWFDTSRLAKGQALVLINFRSGRKAWYASYYKAGKSQLLRIGEYPQFGLKDADEEAQRRLAMLLDGVDPAEVRREQAGAVTFEYVAEYFLLRHTSAKADSGRRDREIIERDFVPEWGQLKAKDIRRTDVKAVLDAIALRGPVAANRALACIRKLFNWALQEQDEGEKKWSIEYNPAAQLKAPGGKEKPSGRALDHPRITGEIKAFWSALDNASMAEELKLMLQLILVTGQRTQELRLAHKAEFDLVNKRWIIPAEHTKNRKAAHLVPLSPLALQLVKEAFKLAPNSLLLFPSPRTGKVFEQNALPRAVRNNKGVFGIADFSPHDLRRTAATHMRRIKVPRNDVKAVLNHRPGDVTAVYDLYDMADEKQKALTKWGRELQSIIRGSAS